MAFALRRPTNGIEGDSMGICGRLRRPAQQSQIPKLLEAQLADLYGGEQEDLGKIEAVLVDASASHERKFVALKALVLRFFKPRAAAPKPAPAPVADGGPPSLSSSLSPPPLATAPAGTIPTMDFSQPPTPKPPTIPPLAPAVLLERLTEERIIAFISSCLRPLACDPRKELRSTTMRALRYLCLAPAIAHAIARDFEWALVCLLELPEGTHRKERTQAMQLARALVRCDAASIPLSLVSTLLAISESEDSLADISLGTLSELLLLQPAVAVQGGVVQGVVKAILEATSPVKSEALLTPLLHLFSTEAGRRLVPVVPVFRAIMAPYLDCEFVLGENEPSGGRQQERSSRQAASRTAIVHILRSWTGLTIFFSSQHLAGALVTALRTNVGDAAMEMRLLELLFQAFQLPIPPAATLYAEANVPRSLPLSADGDVVDQYYSGLLVGFLKWKLLPALEYTAIMATDGAVSLRATILLGELLCMATALMPGPCAARYNRLALLTLASTSAGLASDPSYSELSSISDISARARNVASNIANVRNSFREQRTNKTAAPELSVEVGEDIYVDVVDPNLAPRIRASRVVEGKDGTTWNLVAAMDALRTPGLMARPDANTLRFLRRLLLFFRPSSQQFVTVARNGSSVGGGSGFGEVGLQNVVSVYGRLGCLLFCSVLGSAEERHLLVELLREVGEMLKHNEEPLPVGLPANTIADTCCGDYFVMFGALMGTADGIAVLYESSVLARLETICLEGKRMDLVCLIALNLDLRLPGMGRSIFSTILTSWNVDLRLFATRQLCRLLKDTPTLRTSNILHMLVMQLYDTETRVRAEAVEVLMELSNDPATLDSIAALRPALAHLGEHGVELQLRLLSSGSGLEWLRHGMLPMELRLWRESLNCIYAKQMDLIVAGAVGMHSTPSSRVCHPRCCFSMLARNTNISSSIMGGTGPASRAPTPIQTHLYGVLCTTAAGTDMLRTSKHTDELVNTMLRWRSFNLSDPTASLQLKAAIWAVAHVCSSLHGLKWMLAVEPRIVALFLDIKTHCTSLCIRGVLFYAFGLVARTDLGAEQLGLVQWQVSSYHRITIAMPNDPVNIFRLNEDFRPLLPGCGGLGNAPARASKAAVAKINFDDVPREDESLVRQAIMQHVSDLGNDVIASKTRAALVRGKQAHPDAFTSTVFLDALAHVAMRRYPLAVRRFMHDMFGTLGLLHKHLATVSQVAVSTTPPRLPSIDGDTSDAIPSAVGSSLVQPHATVREQPVPMLIVPEPSADTPLALLLAPRLSATSFSPAGKPLAPLLASSIEAGDSTSLEPAPRPASRSQTNGKDSALQHMTLENGSESKLESGLASVAGDTAAAVAASGAGAFVFGNGNGTNGHGNGVHGENLASDFTTSLDGSGEAPNGHHSSLLTVPSLSLPAPSLSTNNVNGNGASSGLLNNAATSSPTPPREASDVSSSNGLTNGDVSHPTAPPTINTPSSMLVEDNPSSTFSVNADAPLTARTSVTSMTSMEAIGGSFREGATSVLSHTPSAVALPPPAMLKEDDEEYNDDLQLAWQLAQEEMAAKARLQLHDDNANGAHVTEA